MLTIEHSRAPHNHVAMRHECQQPGASHMHCSAKLMRLHDDGVIISGKDYRLSPTEHTIPEEMITVTNRK